MSFRGYKLFFFFTAIFILIGCDSSRTPPKKIEKYQYGDGHIIKDTYDKELYLEYIKERTELETRYMTNFNIRRLKQLMLRNIMIILIMLDLKFLNSITP